MLHLLAYTHNIGILPSMILSSIIIWPQISVFSTFATSMLLFSRIYFPATFALVALPFLAQASSFKTTSKTGLSIPIAKRFPLHGTDGIVDITKVHVSRHHAVEFVSIFFFFTPEAESPYHRRLRKFKRGLDTFERNTGRPHPLGLKLRHSNSKRRKKLYHSHHRDVAGIEKLTHTPGLWYGPITVGTPGQTFTGDFHFE
jgi:hypothetical protein